MERVSMRTLGIVVLLVCITAVQGCLVLTRHALITPQVQSLFKGTYKVDPYMEKHQPISVAVLPFIDQSRSKEGSDAVRKGFYNHFSSLSFKDMELYRVDNFLAKAGLADHETINRTSPQEIGKILGVDAVIYGDISNFDKLFAVMYSQVSVGAAIKMYDTKTGHFLWSGQHIVRIHEGGIATTPVGIIATIVATAMNMRDIQLLRACDDLFRDMVKTIPAPHLAEALQPPTITLLTQDTKNLPKKAGDEIRVVIQGTPKMMAFFDIGQYKKHIDMQEVEPGGYLGIYKIVPGDNVDRAVITGYLADDAGNTAQWVDAIGTVTMDTQPPDCPKRLSSVGRNGVVLLSWEKSAAPDLAGYRIHRSDTPLLGFQEVARTEFTEFCDQGLVNGKRYYYQITAVDGASNESSRSETASGMPLAPGPTPISGVLETDTTWYAGASPYIIEDTVTVKDKAQLLIEPGTEIRSKGGALVIEGSLNAQGDEGHLIVFDSLEEGKIWHGLAFSNVKERENTVKFCRIRNAQAAVTCLSSSPLIEACELTDNETAVRISGTFSKPRVAKNTIQKNRETAVLIEEGAQPAVVENRIQDNAKEGVWVRFSAPVIQRNTITRNGATGVTVTNSEVTIRENTITDNRPFDMMGDMGGKAVDAICNWWGTASGLDILSRVRGKINIAQVLDAAWPEGKPLDLPILASVLGGAVKADSFLVLSNSPYRVTRDVTIDGGATLSIEPGVVIQFDQNTSIIVEDGGIAARGTQEQPIHFIASAASPAPGFYTSAVQMRKSTKLNSVFAYCVARHAATAFDIYYGSPEISYCLIADNAQGGIYCRNDAAPKISYSTFTGNRGEGALNCVGMSNPAVHYNNFVDNETGIRAFSSIYIDARYNWWGKNPPDMNLIWGDPDKNININPPLEKAEEKAFSIK